MKNQQLFFLVFVQLSTFSFGAGEIIERIVGEAYDLSSGDLVYTEEHRWADKSLQHEISYLDLNGEEFASKQLDYQKGPVVPSFTMKNEWSGENITVQWRGNELTGQYSSTVKSVERGPKVIKTSSSRPLVIDAGFDAFIQDNWQKLLGGEKVAFDYVLATRLRVAPLLVSYEGVDDSGLHQFEITSKMRMLNLFVDPIQLRYNDQKQLKEYRGQSNIADKDGDYMVMRIRYRYN